MDALWAVTVVPGSGSTYQHFFPEGSERSACGRSVRARATDKFKEEDVQLCKVCKRKRAAEKRLAAPAAPALPVNADGKMSIIQATELICSFLGDDYISPNAMYNRIWRVVHAGADPACAPAFAHDGKKAFFVRSAVLDWVRAQVLNCHGIDFSSLPPDLARLL